MSWSSTPPSTVKVTLIGPLCPLGDSLVIVKSKTLYSSVSGWTGQVCYGVCISLSRGQMTNGSRCRTASLTLISFRMSLTCIWLRNGWQGPTNPARCLQGGIVARRQMCAFGIHLMGARTTCLTRMKFQRSRRSGREVVPDITQHFSLLETCFQIPQRLWSFTAGWLRLLVFAPSRIWNGFTPKRSIPNIICLTLYKLW